MTRAAAIAANEPTPADLGIHGNHETPALPPAEKAQVPAQTPTVPIREKTVTRISNLEIREAAREIDMADQRQLWGKLFVQVIEQINVLREENGLPPWKPEGLAPLFREARDDGEGEA